MTTFVAKTISRISWGMLLFMAWQFSAVCQEKPEAILKQATEETDKIYTEAYAKEVKSKALSLYPESNYQYMRESYFEGKFTKQKQKFLNDTLVKLYQKNGYILNMETGKWMYPSDEAVKTAEAQKQAKKQADEEARKQAEEKKAKELALQAKVEKQAEQARKQEAKRHATSSNPSSSSKKGEPKDLGGKEDMTDEELVKYAKEKGDAKPGLEASQHNRQLGWSRRAVYRQGLLLYMRISKCAENWRQGVFVLRMPESG